jgi:hypothetical protein
MTKKTQIQKTTDKDREQADAFRKAARDLGCTDSEEQFQGALRKIARHKPSKHVDDHKK